MVQRTAYKQEMHSMKKPTFQISLVLLGACLLHAAIVAEALAGKGKPSGGGYTTVTLDERAGQATSWVNDAREVNGAVLVAGLLGGTDGDQACLWEVTPSGSAYNVSTHVLAGGQVAAAVNANGEIVGDITAYDEVTRLWFSTGLYWPDVDSEPLPLPVLEGDNQTLATGINNAGIIVGRSTFKHATYDNNGNVKDIFEDGTTVAWRVVTIANAPVINGPYVLDTSEGCAFDVNECDPDGIAQVVGLNEDGPVIWNVLCQSDGSVDVLTGPTSLVPQDLRGWGWANGVNNHGDACGKAVGAIAFRTPFAGAFQELSTPRGAVSEANDINDAQQAVGQVIDPRKGEYGVLWRADGSRVDLNSLLDLSSPWRRIWWGRAITSSGIIAATGALDSDGENGRALLMIPK